MDEFRPTVSVVVPTHNRSQLLPDVVAALRSQNYPEDRYEIIIADNGSTDDTALVVARLSELGGAAVRYVSEPRRGSHMARNTGFKTAVGEVLALIDDDIVVDGDWLPNLTAPYAEPRVGCVGGRITIRWQHGEPPSWVDPYLRVLGQLDCGLGVADVQELNAGSFSIRRGVLFEVGGYNPCNAPGDPLVGDGESGLCRKVRRAGWRVVFTHDAQAWHLVDASKVDMEYMRRRFRNQGASDVYTRVQESEHGSWVARAPVDILRSVLGVFRSPRDHRSGFVARDLRRAYAAGKAHYYWRLALDSRLRGLARRTDWISDI